MNAFKDNIWKIYLFSFLVNLFFITGVLVPFFTDWGGISFFQILLLQSVFMLSIFLSEVPTGVVADKFGRKHSLILAVFVEIIAIITYTLAPQFMYFIIAEILWGVGVALLSGADEAFVYDSLKKIKNTKQAKKIFANKESVGLVGIMVAAPIGSFIAATIGLRETMLFITIPMFLALLVGLTFKEPKNKKSKESRRYLDVLINGTKYLKNHKILRMLALNVVVLSAIAYFYLWLYQPMLQQAGVDLVYFGWVHATMVIAEIIILTKIEFLEKIFKSKKGLLFWGAIITGGLMIVGGLTTFLPVVLLVIVVGGAFGLTRRTMFASYLNKYIPSDKRATVLSNISMMNRFLLIIANIFVGLLVEWSLNYTLIILGTIAVVFTLVFRIEEKHLIE
ncbi:MFS transporter [Candidatus Micrarchaeota archaeon]|nr:MFS transporter [Candidatus Micrarchaeota archaeon]